MKNYTYNFEIKDLLTQFAAAFDDVVIKRYNNQRQSAEEISVRYVYGPKQRVMYDIVNKAQNLTLPVIAINAASISRDPSRVFNKLDGFYNYKNDTLLNTIKTPTPINITINFSILARYMQDMDQILSNFVPFANPYIILSWKEPMGDTKEVIEIRSEVLWDGNISLTTPTEMTYSDKFRIVADTTFTIKGWLFKDTNNSYPTIYSVRQNMIDSTRILNLQDLDDVVDTDDYGTIIDSLTSTTTNTTIGDVPTLTNLFYFTSGTNLNSLFEYKVTPQNNNVDNKIQGQNTSEYINQYIDTYIPGTPLPVTESTSLNTQLTGNNNYMIYGTGLCETHTILISSNNTSITSPISSNITTEFTFVSSSITGTASGFTLRPEYYNVVNCNLITVSIPALSGIGLVDLIVCGPNGWASSFTIGNFHLNDVNANCYCCP